MENARPRVAENDCRNFLFESNEMVIFNNYRASIVLHTDPEHGIGQTECPGQAESGS